MTSAAGLQTNARRLEVYVRVSLYLLLGAEVFLVLGWLASAATQPARGWAAAVVLMVLVVLHTAANVAACRWAMTAMRDRPVRWSRRAVIGLLVWVLLSVTLVL